MLLFMQQVPVEALALYQKLLYEEWGILYLCVRQGVHTLKVVMSERLLTHLQ